MDQPIRQIGGLLFPGMDQTDFTGPFEVLSRLPNSRFWAIGATTQPIRDMAGLILTPEVDFTNSPPLDVLVVPGGAGVTQWMERTDVRAFLQRQAAQAQMILSVCTGALLLGASGLLRGRSATTHWASHSLLAEMGAIPQKQRVVQDGSLISCSGVTAGFDGALLAASLLESRQAAQEIQLYLEYAPAPPFQSGTPEQAPAEVLAAVLQKMEPLLQERRAVIRRLRDSGQI